LSRFREGRGYQDEYSRYGYFIVIMFIIIPSAFAFVLDRIPECFGEKALFDEAAEMVEWKTGVFGEC
jgi:hypothetical protein